MLFYAILGVLGWRNRADADFLDEVDRKQLPHPKNHKRKQKKYPPALLVKWIPPAAESTPVPPEDKCHRAAMYTGSSCICRDGLVGDGVYDCHPPVPVIQSATSFIRDSKLPFIRLNYSIDTNFTAAVIFCSVNGNLCRALTEGRTAAVCRGISSNNRDVAVKISFDMTHWSGVIYVPSPRRPFWQIISLVLVLVCLAYIGLVIAPNSREWKCRWMKSTPDKIL